MICAYLLYNKSFQSTEKALAFYGEARTKNNKVFYCLPVNPCLLDMSVFICSVEECTSNSLSSFKSFLAPF